MVLSIFCHVRTERTECCHLETRAGYEPHAVGFICDGQRNMFDYSGGTPKSDSSFAPPPPPSGAITICGTSPSPLPSALATDTLSGGELQTIRWTAVCVRIRRSIKPRPATAACCLLFSSVPARPLGVRYLGLWRNDLVHTHLYALPLLYAVSIIYSGPVSYFLSRSPGATVSWILTPCFFPTARVVIFRTRYLSIPRGSVGFS